MTAKEFHVQNIIPARLKLQDLEKQYRELYRKECGEKVGERAHCGNCAFSCVISTTDHNECMGGKCTCCNDWCFRWVPENKVSKCLREKHHYDNSLYERLAAIFDDDFLTKCCEDQKANIVLEMLQVMERFDET